MMRYQLVLDNGCAIAEDRGTYIAVSIRTHDNETWSERLSKNRFEGAGARLRRAYPGVSIYPLGRV
jgi:hypothetical protein